MNTNFIYSVGRKTINKLMNLKPFLYSKLYMTVLYDSDWSTFCHLEQCCLLLHWRDTSPKNRTSSSFVLNEHKEIQTDLINEVESDSSLSGLHLSGGPVTSVLFSDRVHTHLQLTGRFILLPVLLSLHTHTRAVNMYPAVSASGVQGCEFSPWV